MYQFLCVDANMPPPYLEVHWRHSSNGSFDEMDMDDMFDKHQDGQEEEDQFGMDNHFEEEGEMEAGGESEGANPGVWKFADGETGGGNANVNTNQANGNVNNNANQVQVQQDRIHQKILQQQQQQGAKANEMDDGLDIKSLSLVRGQFM